MIIIRDDRGFVDLTFIDCKGHDPRPGLEWDRPVVLNGKEIEILSEDEYCALVKLTGTDLITIVSRNQMEYL
jgi:hypothetical protein